MLTRLLDCGKSNDSIPPSIKTLTTINGKPAADFWKEVEAQPGKKP